MILRHAQKPAQGQCFGIYQTTNPKPSNPENSESESRKHCVYAVLYFLQFLFSCSTTGNSQCCSPGKPRGLCVQLDGVIHQIITRASLCRLFQLVAIATVGFLYIADWMNYPVRVKAKGALVPWCTSKMEVKETIGNGLAFQHMDGNVMMSVHFFSGYTTIMAVTDVHQITWFYHCPNKKYHLLGLETTFRQTQMG